MNTNNNLNVVSVNNNNVIVKRGFMFYADLGEGEGSEQGGLRPVLVVQNDVGNRNSPTVVVIPLTSKQTKAKLPTHVELKNELGLTKDSLVLAEQIRAIDKKRLKGYIGRVRKHTMEKVDEAIMVSAGVKDSREVEEIKTQVEEVRYYERRVKEAKLEGESTTKISQLAIRMDYEYRKLENMCSMARKFVTDFYKRCENEDIASNVNFGGNLRVIAN